MNKLVKAKIRLLKLVRTRIANGSDFYVCNAIKRVLKDKPELTQAGLELISYIREALNADQPIDQISVNIHTLECWIEAHQPNSEYLEEPKKARLMWIDWMINCYEEDFKV